MSICADEVRTIELLATHLLGLTETELSGLIEDGRVLKDTFFALVKPVEGDRFACFYAPFDWVNDSADIVLIGITPDLRPSDSRSKSGRFNAAGGSRLRRAHCHV
jgi:hypothetical protein